MQNFYEQTMTVSQPACARARVLNALCDVGLSFIRQNATLLAWDTWW